MTEHGGYEAVRNPRLLASEYVILRRCDVEALIEEHAIDEDPFWRPVEGVTVALPSCSCGSIRLYAENPPRLGPHHAQACGRFRTAESNATAAYKADELFPNIPEGWRVAWCNKCLYAVTFTVYDADTYGAEWFSTLDEAARHEH